MNYIGKWVFDSIGTQDDEKGMIYLNGDEYLASPMPYIDETDEEAVADEINERKKTIGMERLQMKKYYINLCLYLAEYQKQSLKK